MAKNNIVLGYFDCRDLGQPIRYLLKYAAVEFTDKRYPFGEGTAMQDLPNIKKFWFAEKYNLNLDFPNAPYLIDGDLRITQSVAILRYLGRKYGLSATDEPYLTQQDMVEQQLQDLRMSFIMGVLMAEDYEKSRAQFIDNTLPPQLEQLSKFLGDKDWLIGDLNYVDFIAYERLECFRLFNAESVEKFPNLSQYIKRFESLPAIANYLSSNEFKSWPFYSIANWGSYVNTSGASV